MDNVAAGLLIRELRKEKNLRIVDLANQIGISQPTMSRVENGTQELNITMLSSICKLLEIPVSQFIYTLEKNSLDTHFDFEISRDLPIKEQLLHKIDQLSTDQQRALYYFLNTL